MNLTRGRISIPGARYFVTICEQNRKPVFVTAHQLSTMVNITHRIITGADATLIGACAMPDHLHLVFELGNRLSLDRLISKFKTLTREHLPSGTSWQRNYFEHRLRPDETVGGYALYLFLNPYRARLIRHDEEWPGWIKGADFDFDFLHLLVDGIYPPSEWIHDSITLDLPPPIFTGDV